MPMRSVYFSPATYLFMSPLAGGEKPPEGEPAFGPGAAPAARPGPGTESGKGRECGGGDERAARG
jgi:hypothetical protein